MDRRTYASMAIMAGLGIFAAGIVYLAVRPRAERRAPTSPINAVRLAAEIIQLRIDGSDSEPKRRALESAARKLPDGPLARSLSKFAGGDLEGAAAEPAETPFALGLRGWVLVELGRRPAAADTLKLALKDTAEDWEFRSLFEAALRKAT